MKLFPNCSISHHISGMFDGDFNLSVWQKIFNRQTKVTANTILRGHYRSILGRSAKLNVDQSVLVVKSPNLYLMSVKCTTPTICHDMCHPCPQATSHCGILGTTFVSCAGGVASEVMCLACKLHLGNSL